MLLKFRTNTCSKCDILEQVMSNMTLDITVDTVHVNENPELAGEYGVMQVPTLILVDEQGNELKRNTGILSEEELLEFIER